MIEGNYGSWSQKGHDSGTPVHSPLFVTVTCLNDRDLPSADMLVVQTQVSALVGVELAQMSGKVTSVHHKWSRSKTI